MQFQKTQDPGKNKLKTKWPYHLWTFAVLLLVAVTVFQYTDFENIRQLLAGIKPGWALAGVGFYLSGHLLRAVRLGTMLGDADIPLFRLFCWSGLHAVWNYLLPARTGELSLVIYLRRYESQSAAKVTAVLIAVRGLEMLLTLVLVVLVFIPFGDFLKPEWKLPIQAAGLFFFTTIVLIAWLIRHKNWSRFQNKTGQQSDNMRQNLLNFLGRVCAQLQFSFKNPKWPWVMTLTLLIWCLNFAMYYTLFPALGRQLPFVIVVVIVIGMAFAQITPIQSFFSAGSHEIVWVPMLSAAGLSLSEAVSFAISSHILVLIYVLGFAILLTALRLGVVQKSLDKTF